jgi:thioesterase domain-containing protein
LDTHANWGQDSWQDSVIKAYQRVAFHVKNAWMSGRTGFRSFAAEKLREGNRRMLRRWEALSSQISFRLGWRKNRTCIYARSTLRPRIGRIQPQASGCPTSSYLSQCKATQGKVDTFFGWQNYVRDITLIELPVYPAGMLIEPFVAQLATHIERQLTSAEDGLTPAPQSNASKQWT